MVEKEWSGLSHGLGGMLVAAMPLMGLVVAANAVSWVALRADGGPAGLRLFVPLALIAADQISVGVNVAFGSSRLLFNVWKYHSICFHPEILLPYNYFYGVYNGNSLASTLLLTAMAATLYFTPRKRANMVSSSQIIMTACLCYVAGIGCAFIFVTKRVVFETENYDLFTSFCSLFGGEEPMPRQEKLWRVLKDLRLKSDSYSPKYLANAFTAQMLLPQSFKTMWVGAGGETEMKWVSLGMGPNETHTEAQCYDVVHPSQELAYYSIYAVVIVALVLLMCALSLRFVCPRRKVSLERNLSVSTTSLGSRLGRGALVEESMENAHVTYVWTTSATPAETQPEVEDEEETDTTAFRIIALEFWLTVIQAVSVVLSFARSYILPPQVATIVDAITMLTAMLQVSLNFGFFFVTSSEFRVQVGVMIIEPFINFYKCKNVLV